MRERTLKACLGAVLVAVCYVAYVVVTQGDGIAFASAVGAIGALSGYMVGVTE